jgi:CheY-like chemotaxis protein
MSEPDRSGAPYAWHPAMAVRALVLIVDDARDNREGYAEYLTYCGFQILQAGDGEKALAHAREHRPDAIVLDIRLPGQNGLEVARALRAEKEFARTVIVALSACVTPADQKAAIESGCDAFLGKPCLPDALVAELNRLLESDPKKKHSGIT